MSENEQLVAGPSIATLEAILAAANREAVFPSKTMERLLCWLSDALAQAARRAQATQLSKADIDRLENDYLRFRDVIESLQNRDDPPPPLPMLESGITVWDHWLIGNKHFGPRQGRRNGSDWRLIAALLALYETVSGKDASAAQADGPTMRFLENAGQALAASGHHFAPPNAEALRKQFPELRQCYLPMEHRAVAEIISTAGE